MKLSNHHSKSIIFVILLITGIFLSLFGFLKRNMNVVRINDTVIRYKAAISNQEKSIGLSHTESLGEKEGMLFFFNQESPGFWMKDMSFAIDIIWIANGAVVKIDHDVQPPQKSEDVLQTYSPPSPIDFVLEVNSGFAKSNNIEVGDKVKVN